MTPMNPILIIPHLSERSHPAGVTHQRNGKNLKIANRIQLTVLFIALFATSAMACKVPVFRYALERWNADKYEVLIIYRAPLDAPSHELVDKLKSPKFGATANFQVQVVSASDLRDKRLVKLWSNRTAEDVNPMMVVLYPRTAMEVPDRILSVQPLTESHVQHLLHSPVREQIVQRLSAGQSAVWIFVPCGDETKDAAALKVLEERIAVNRERLTVPTAEELEIDSAILAKNKIPLRIEFSVVRLDRKDAREAFLLSSLMKSEADLDATQPMAFPVFGRGRVLYALVGDGIMAETTDTACQFIAGPCSCQVKNQNPGFDLLINNDWENVVAGSVISAAIPDEAAEPRLLTIPPGRRNK